MAPASVKVFGSPTSAEVARVLMCLFEKDVEFQLVRVDAYRGTQRMPQYLKLQVYSCSAYHIVVVQFSD
jgi:glutathione S-transferase